MKAIIKQQLLMNAMTFAYQKLPANLFGLVDPGKFDYKISGLTEMVDFKCPGLWLQSYIYSDGGTKTMIFDGEKIYSENPS